MAEPQPLNKEEMEALNSNDMPMSIHSLSDLAERIEATVQALEADARKWQEFELAYTSWDALPPPNQRYVEMCAELARLRGVETANKSAVAWLNGPVARMVAEISEQWWGLAKAQLEVEVKHALALLAPTNPTDDVVLGADVTHLFKPTTTDAASETGGS